MALRVSTCVLVQSLLLAAVLLGAPGPARARTPADAPVHDYGAADMRSGPATQGVPMPEVESPQVESPAATAPAAPVVQSPRAQPAAHERHRQPATQQLDASSKAPARGMTMRQVEAGYGPPVQRQPAVGRPPITRWDYPGYRVYFEYNHVVHSVISDDPEPLDHAARLESARP